MNAHELITLHEGRMLKIYTDTAHKVSAGVGRNLTDRGLRDDEVDLMFKNDMQETWDECAKYPWFIGLSQARKAACLDLMFNVGATKFRSFTKFISAMAASNYEAAADELVDSSWFKQVGPRAKHDEALIRKEQWPA